MPGSIGQEDEPASSAGGAGSLNAKMRLMTSQLNTIANNGGGGSTTAVSGAITVGNSPDVGQTRGPWAVSGTVSTNPHAVWITGPAAVSGTVTINTPGTLGVSGTVSTNPHAVWITGPAAVSGTVSTIAGGNAVAHGANPTAVAAGARADSLVNRAGVPFVIGGHPNIQTLAQNYTSVQTDQALVTVATGLKIVVTSVMLKCNAANTVNVSGRVGFGTTNTPAYGNAGLLLTDPGIAPGSGIGRGSGAGILGVGTDDQDVRVTLSAPTGGSIDVMISYFTIES